ncbi:MAG TPA: hypothetical protein VF331_12560 [Polyangiales bacterium]
MKLLGIASALLLASFLAACGGSTQLVCKRDMITGSDRCQPVSNSGGQAAATAGVAAGAWGIGGCTVNGCTQPYRCNSKTKQCEPLHCTKRADCNGYDCDLDRGTCR